VLRSVLVPAPLRVLIVEDERDIADNIADYLASRRHAVTLAANATDGMQLANARDFDVIVLDVMLPDMDGFSFCRRLREDGRATPVLMLTARERLSDKLEGFRSGTDDYLTKPFALEELTVRLIALSRRGRASESRTLRVGPLELDRVSRQVVRSGRPLELSAAPLKILIALMEASPGLVPRETLEALLWGDEARAPDALRAQIYLVRKAIELPSTPPLLVTVHGVGYRIASHS
jgi:DNA-binding response OmpR family regulator